MKCRYKIYGLLLFCADCYCKTITHRLRSPDWMMKCPGRKVQLPVYDDEYWNTTFRVAIKTGEQIESICECSGAFGRVSKSLVKKGDRVLDLGCGLSFLGAFLCNNTKCLSVLGVDTNERVLHHQARAFKTLSPRLSFQQMNAFALPDLEKFNIIFDKGTTDLFFASSKEAVKVPVLLNQLHGLLQDDGILVIVTGVPFSCREKYMDNKMWYIREELLVPELGTMLICSKK